MKRTIYILKELIKKLDLMYNPKNKSSVHLYSKRAILNQVEKEIEIGISKEFEIDILDDKTKYRITIQKII